MPPLPSVTGQQNAPRSTTTTAGHTALLDLDRPTCIRDLCHPWDLWEPLFCHPRGVEWVRCDPRCVFGGLCLLVGLFSCTGEMGSFLGELVQKVHAVQAPPTPHANTSAACCLPCVYRCLPQGGEGRIQSNDGSASLKAWAWDCPHSAHIPLGSHHRLALLQEHVVAHVAAVVPPDATEARTSHKSETETVAVAESKPGSMVCPRRPSLCLVGLRRPVCSTGAFQCLLSTMCPFVVAQLFASQWGGHFTFFARRPMRSFTSLAAGLFVFHAVCVCLDGVRGRLGLRAQPPCDDDL